MITLVGSALGDPEDFPEESEQNQTISKLLSLLHEINDDERNSVIQDRPFKSCITYLEVGLRSHFLKLELVIKGLRYTF
jgi:hypothetical protein